MEINYINVYKEIDFISRELRKAIKHMPRYNRYNEEYRIINVLLDVKIAVKLACKGRNYSLDSDKLYNDLITLGTLLDAVARICLSPEPKDKPSLLDKIKKPFIKIIRIWNLDSK